MRWIPASLYRPSNDPLHQFAVEHPTLYGWLTALLWGFAILFAIGDIFTTWLGVTPLLGPPHENLTESVALTKSILVMFGPWALAPMKFLVLGVVALLGQLFVQPYRLVFPLIAIVCNAFAVCHNIELLIQYGMIELPF